MNVIFLDIDGVLNSNEELLNLMTEDFDPINEIFDNHLLVLQKIVQSTDAKIVLSSSWRMGYIRKLNGKQDTCKGYDAVTKKLKEFNMSLLDVTPYLPEETRGKEIAKWLEMHPETTNFLILDDEKVGCLEEHMLLLDNKLGLTEKDIEASIKILRRKQ